MVNVLNGLDSGWVHGIYIWTLIRVQWTHIQTIYPQMGIILYSLNCMQVNLVYEIYYFR